MVEALRQQGRLLLIAMWLGAGVFFAAVVAPGAFEVLPTSELAGRIVGRTLSWLNISGTVLSLVLFASAWAARRRSATAGERHLRLAEMIALAVMWLATVATEFAINKRIARLRMDHEVASLAPTDPVRIEFGMLHGASVIVFGVSLLAALIALLVIVRRRFVTSLKRKEEKDSGNNRAPAAVAQQL